MPKRQHSTKKQNNKVFRGVKSRYLVLTLRMVATLLAALILTGLAWWLIKGDYFRVNRITCEQDGFPCSESIRDLFQEAMGANIFLLKPKRSAAAVLLKQPVLAVVTIHKRLPNQLRVTVQSRQPFALLEGSDGEKVLVDKAGVGLPTPPESFTGPRLKVGSLPVIGETTVDPLIIQGLSLIELLQRSYIPFEYIWYADSQSLTTQLANDIIATFSGQKDLSGQVDSLQYILHHSRMEDKAIQGIDLRFQKPIITFTQPKDRAS